MSELEIPGGELETPALPAITPTSGDEELNSILERLDPNDTIDAPTEFIRSFDGPDAPAAEPEVAEEPAEEPAAEPEAVAVADLTSALNVLGKAQVPAALINGLTDGQKIEWAKGLEPGQAQLANVHRELGELRKSAGTNEEPASEGVGSSAEPAVNPEVNLSTFSSAIVEELGEDTAKALSAPIAAVLAYAQGLEQRLESMQGGMRDIHVSNARRELAGEYPQLSDGDTFAKVEDLAGALVHTGKYSTMTELLRASARVVLAEELAEGKATARQVKSEQRNLGQLEMPAPSAPEAEQPWTAEAIQDAAIEALESGLDAAEVRRKLPTL